MNHIIKELEKLLCGDFSWSEQKDTFIISVTSELPFITKVQAATQWIVTAPLECVNLSVNNEGFSIIFQKTEVKEAT